uniref:Probable molybdopterin-synthase adenylyltransferase n=1 Tax=Melanthalia intermedia TaxID=172989 RepID=A0A345UB03_9FLOR|nr:molybdopterin biosynthesis protein [Melanthalia intermedia]AXI97639.1 molybdopterin biosynthesis protein [Melanthalia intermedia]
MLYPFSSPVFLSKVEYQRYARHLILDNIGVSGQKRLKSASVLFVGAGGLGSPGLVYLASSGVGCLGIIDYDTISYSNLHRQILYNYTDIDQLKASIAYSKITRINPECTVFIYPFMLNQANCQDVVKKYDIVIDASDNFETRYLINYACYAKHKVHIYGAIQSFEGHISVFNYKSGCLYSDLYPNILGLQSSNCNNTGILGVLTGVTGVLQVTEAIKIILGLGETLSGYLLIYNSLNASFRRVKIPLFPIKYVNNYQFNSRTIKLFNTIDQYQLSLMIDKSSFILIDIRRPPEFFKDHLLKAVNIPLKNIKSKSVISFICARLKSRKIVVYCYDNLRSLIVSQILYNHKIHHYRLNYRY